MPNNMVNYTSWPITLPNMKAIKQTTAEVLHSQSEEDGQTDKPYKLHASDSVVCFVFRVIPYHRMRDIKQIEWKAIEQKFTMEKCIILRIFRKHMR